MTPLDQLRLRLPEHDFDRLLQAAEPIAATERDAFLRDIAMELGQHEVIGPGLLHRIISEVQQRSACSGGMRSSPASYVPQVGTSMPSSRAIWNRVRMSARRVGANRAPISSSEVLVS